MKMVRYFKKTWRRRQKIHKVQYEFSVPNLQYLDLAEIDSESALDGIDVFVLKTRALEGNRCILAMSKDFLKKYKDTYHLSLLECDINPQIGMSLQEAMFFVSATEEDIQDSGNGFYRYIFVNIESLSLITKDLETIRSKKLNHYKVQVAEL